MSETNTNGPSIAVAGIVYLLLWIPALLLAIGTSFLGGYVGSGFAPLSGWLPLSLVLPAVLVGLKSLRVSAAVSLLLLIVEVVAGNWPHIALSDLWDSDIDKAFSTLTAFVMLAAVLSPFPSIIMFVRRIRDT